MVAQDRVIESLSAKEGPSTRIPAEIWQEIISQTDLSNETLFNLAFLSKGLYHVCLQGYLRTCDAKPQKRITINLRNTVGRVYDALIALRLPFFHLDTDELICTIPSQSPWIRPGLGLEANNANLFHHIGRLRAAILNMGHIRHMVLRFEGKRCSPSSSVVRGESAEIWSTALTRLFTTILERDCQSFEIYGLDAMGDTVAPTPRAKARYRDNANNWNVIMPNRIEDTISLDKITTHLTGAPRSQTKLRHLTIGTKVLVMSWPLLEWLYTTLLLSPIESLKISSAALPPHTYRPLIPRHLAPAISGLKRLEIERYYNMYPQEFLSWLGSFQELTSFSIFQYHLFIDPNVLGKEDLEWPTLPNLTELHVCAPWFELFFPAVVHQRVFPTLQHLTVVFGPDHKMEKVTGTPIRCLLEELAKLRAKNQLGFLMTLEFHDVLDSLDTHWRSQASKEVGSWAGCFTGVKLVVSLCSTDEDPPELTHCMVPRMPHENHLNRWLNGFHNMSTLTIMAMPGDLRAVLYSPPRRPQAASRNLMSNAQFIASLVAPEIIQKLECFEVNGVRDLEIREITIVHPSTNTGIQFV